jgi:signal transduction histidine kinase
MGFDSRRAFRVLQLGVQFRLPLYLLLITLAFLTLFAWHAYSAYAELYTMVMTNVPESFQEQLLGQTQDFSIVGAVILGGLALTILGFSIAYTHTLLGPIVALRRQVQAMKDGNYRTRNKLRKTDAAHQGLADDLNELSAILQHAQASNRTSQSA